MKSLRYSIIIALSIMTIALNAQDKPKWDVNNPPGNSKTITINTTEGTWMNLDVSPDGQTLAFDMLGDIFTMPSTGGKATPIRTGLAWEVQPRWSPDGSKLLFTSDAGGGDNLWTMNPDGSEAQQMTKQQEARESKSPRRRMISKMSMNHRSHLMADIYTTVKTCTQVVTSNTIRIPMTRSTWSKGMTEKLARPNKSRAAREEHVDL